MGCSANIFLQTSVLLVLCSLCASGCTSVDGTIDLSGTFSTTTLDKAILSMCSDHYDATTLILSNNSLLTISENAFDNFYSLKHLILSYNQLTSLPSTVFHKLWNLQTLDVSYNNLAVLQADLLKNKAELTSVSFEHNNITEVEFMFVNEEHENLATVNLQYNSLEYLTPWPYQIYKHTENYFKQRFYLEHNHIRELSNPYNWSYNLVYPHNRLIYLMYNEMPSISFDSVIIFLKNVSEADIFAAYISLELHGSHNPYFCDCNMYDFAFRLRNSIFKWSNYENWVYQCIAPPEVAGQDWLRLTPYEKLVCNLTDGCPSGCFCQERPYDGTTFVNCSGAGLTEMPDALPVTPYNKYVLILDDNRITELKSTQYTQYIFNISLSRNQIHYLDPSILKHMTSLEKLDLQFNNLRELPTEIKRLEYGKVDLYGNPIACNCEILWMAEWMKLSREPGNMDLSCVEESGKQQKIAEATQLSLRCTVEHLLPVFVAVGVLVLLVVLCILSVYKCPYETKVVLYKLLRLHPWDRYQVDPSEDKEYDVYWSYDHEDFDVRNWILCEVTSQLKQKIKSFKSYNPMTDYEAGAENNGMYDELAKALDKSKRILIVLSEGSFELDNRQEFEIQDSVNGRPDQIIYIVYNGKAKERVEEKINMEPWKTRLTGRRVLDPDEKLFFDKLRYEMPQTPKRRPTRVEVHSNLFVP